MTSRTLAALAALALLAVAAVSAQESGAYRLALPGYRYEFPRDHFSHPAFQTEWWYYTGNLRTREGRAFGFELTFFRQAVAPPERLPGRPPSPWDVEDVYLAHFALSDLGARRFHHDQRMNRAGPGLAGASLEMRRVWNGNWQVRWEGDTQQLTAIALSHRLQLTLRPAKPPVIHGVNGVSQKAAGPGRASHYVSFTRLVTSGTLEVEGERFEVEGLSWMDHEFFTHQLSAEHTGWDWLSLQMEDGTELMLYRLRRRDGGVDPFSAGTFVEATGRARHLTASDVRLEPTGRTWTSPSTGGVYPLEWSIRVAPLALSLQLRTPLDAQEIVSRHASIPSYWEGAIRVAGTRHGTPIAGSGYLEMTGYDRRVELDSHR
jgi:predicted secreted hydrolase